MGIGTGVGDEGRQTLLNLESIPSIKYRPLSDYDDEFKLKPGLE